MRVATLFMSQTVRQRGSGPVHKIPGRQEAPRHVVRSTDTVDLSDPFQRRWYIRQVLLQGRAEDVRTLDLREVCSMLDDLELPAPVLRLWQRFLERRDCASG